MDVDPRTNVVVFQLNNSADELAVGRAPTVADDGVRQAWGRVLHDHGAAPESVVALHSEWEPTPTDAAFIEATFPDAAVTFNFRRPNPDGWEAAFTAARETMAKAAAQPADGDRPSTPATEAPHPANVGGGGSVDGNESSAHQPTSAGPQETTDSGAPSTHQPTDAGQQGPINSGALPTHRPVGAGPRESAGGGASAVRSGVDGDSGQDSSRGELLPVLWSAGSPRASLLEAVPHWPVAAGRLHLALAVVAPTPRGTIGTYHVTHHQLGGQSFNELMAEACENLAAGLRVNGHETDDGQLLSLSGTLVAAAVCLPDFYRRLSEITNADRLVVGLPCPDEVYVAAADSPVAAVIHRAVHESEYPTTELIPSVLSIVGDDIEVVSERG